MPETNRAAPDSNRGAAPKDQRARIFSFPPVMGNCASRGIQIDLRGCAPNCRTCSAWHRWYSAHRLASRYLKETAR